MEEGSSARWREALDARAAVAWEAVFARWRALPAWERSVVPLTALCLLGALTLQPIVGLVSPEWAEAAVETRTPRSTGWVGFPSAKEMPKFRELHNAQDVRDPWGRRWLLGLESSPGPPRVRVTGYSGGPNGVDEGERATTSSRSGLR